MTEKIQDLFRYDLLVKEALRSVVRRVLTLAAREGLPGEHHFYITFQTNYPGLRLSTRMRERYPDEMTIVLQHQFWDLAVNEHNFEVGLSFSGVPERLLIPFDAITGFFDPSVQFGLKFEPKDTTSQPAHTVPRSVESLERELAQSTIRNLGQISQDKQKLTEEQEATHKDDAFASIEQTAQNVDGKTIASPTKLPRGKSSKPSQSGAENGKKKVTKEEARDTVAPETATQEMPVQDLPSQDNKIVSIDAFRKK